MGPEPGPLSFATRGARPRRRGPNLDFDAAQVEAESTWEAHLARVELHGPSKQDFEIFYSALCHSSCPPSPATSTAATAASTSTGRRWHRPGRRGRSYLRAAHIFRRAGGRLIPLAILAGSSSIYGHGDPPEPRAPAECRAGRAPRDREAVHPCVGRRRARQPLQDRRADQQRRYRGGVRVRGSASPRPGGREDLDGPTRGRTAALPRRGPHPRQPQESASGPGARGRHRQPRRSRHAVHGAGAAAGSKSRATPAAGRAISGR